MARVLVVSTILPCARNAGGPPQLLSDLIRGRPSGIDIDLLVYAAQPEGWPDADLLKSVSSVRFLEPAAISKLRKAAPWRLASVRYPLPTDVDWTIYDLIWLYPEWLSWDFRHVPGRMLISGMDSATMLFSRALLDNFAYRPWASAIKLAQAMLVESLFARKHRVHVVGRRDRQVYLRLAPKADCFYVPHPLGEHLPEARKPRQDGDIVVGVAGGYQPFYSGSFPDRMVDALGNSRELAAKVSFYLLGRGWDGMAGRLVRAGFRVRQESWVPDYKDFLSAIDIQLFPLIVGAGTKCKVLAAIASGVIPLATPIAYENILEDQRLPTIRQPSDVPTMLHKLVSDIAGGWTGCDAWVQSVRREHDRETVAAEFWTRALAVPDSC